MSGTNDWLAQRFEAHRGHLRRVAYRMLGSLGEADDAVQEAWLRLSRSEASDIDKGLCPGQHCQQTQQQYFLKRVGYFASLAWVRHVPKMGKESNRLAKPSTIRRRVVHGHPPTNQRTPTDSAHPSFVTHFLHPIALRQPCRT